MLAIRVPVAVGCISSKLGRQVSMRITVKDGYEIFTAASADAPDGPLESSGMARLGLRHLSRKDAVISEQAPRVEALPSDVIGHSRHPSRREFLATAAALASLPFHASPALADRPALPADFLWGGVDLGLADRRGA